MKYGAQILTLSDWSPADFAPTVNLGKSGLKVSKIILGAMTYGSSKWDKWVLDEEESIKHIKAAYDAGINAFDTADVGTSVPFPSSVPC